MRRSALASLAIVALTALLATSAAFAGNELARAVRQATARFHSLTQAERAGYGPFPPGAPLHECIMALDQSGGMGFHWVNGTLVDATLDAAHPEVLVYAPKPNGGLELVALEYVIFDSAVPPGTTPTILGQALTFVPDGNRYEIPAFWQRHVWLYEKNEAGLFADFNPAVSC